MFAFNLKKEIDVMSTTLNVKLFYFIYFLMLNYFNVDETRGLSKLTFTFMVFI